MNSLLIDQKGILIHSTYKFCFQISAKQNLFNPVRTKDFKLKSGQSNFTNAQFPLSFYTLLDFSNLILVRPSNSMLALGDKIQKEFTFQKELKSNNENYWKIISKRTVWDRKIRTYGVKINCTFSLIFIPIMQHVLLL